MSLGISHRGTPTMIAGPSTFPSMCLATVRGQIHRSHRGGRSAVVVSEHLHHDHRRCPSLPNRGWLAGKEPRGAMRNGADSTMDGKRGLVAPGGSTRGNCKTMSSLPVRAAGRGIPEPTETCANVNDGRRPRLVVDCR